MYCVPTQYVLCSTGEAAGWVGDMQIGEGQRGAALLSTTISDWLPCSPEKLGPVLCRNTTSSLPLPASLPRRYSAHHWEGPASLSEARPEAQPEASVSLCCVGRWTLLCSALLHSALLCPALPCACEVQNCCSAVLGQDDEAIPRQSTQYLPVY